jgi:hypothetical protein
MYSAKGMLKRIESTQIVSEKFKKRGFVVGIPDGEKWVQDVYFELTQERTELLDNYTEMTNIEIGFVLKGREWISPQGEKRYFNTLQVLTIKEAGSSKPETKKENTPSEHWSGLKGEMAQDHVDQGLNNMLADDDLPF